MKYGMVTQYAYVLAPYAKLDGVDALYCVNLCIKAKAREWFAWCTCSSVDMHSVKGSFGQSFQHVMAALLFARLKKISGTLLCKISPLFRQPYPAGTVTVNFRRY